MHQACRNHGLAYFRIGSDDEYTPGHLVFLNHFSLTHDFNIKRCQPKQSKDGQSVQKNLDMHRIIGEFLRSHPDFIKEIEI
jgi:hypothetical protein